MGWLPLAVDFMLLVRICRSDQSSVSLPTFHQLPAPELQSQQMLTRHVEGLGSRDLELKGLRFRGVGLRDLKGFRVTSCAQHHQRRGPRSSP